MKSNLSGHPFAKKVTISGITRQVIFNNLAHTLGSAMVIRLYSNLYPMHETISAEWTLEKEGDFAPTAKAVYTPSESIFMNAWYLSDSELSGDESTGDSLKP